jgi:hypothetical protein
VLILVSRTKTAKAKRLADPIARKILSNRRRLRAIMRLVEETPGLASVHAAEGRRLVEEIEEGKQQIRDLGLGVDEAIDDARPKMIKTGRKGLSGIRWMTKTKGSAGVGMYRLGGSLKIWR